MKFAAGNAQHIGARSQQEDAFGFCDPTDRALTGHAGLVGVVADGMGGMARGSEASRAAVRAFLRAYETKAAAAPIPHALSRALAAANDAVLALNDTDPPSADAGTTLAAAVIHRNGLHWIAAGDSRIYLLRDKSLTQITMDHVYARRLHEEVARGAMTRTAMLEHPERASLTSYLGKPDLSEVDRSVRPIPLQPGDRVIVCTDGLYRALSEEELVAAFRRSLNRACDEAIGLAVRKQRTQQDNMTVIALSHEPDGTRYRSSSRGRPAGMPWVVATVASLSLVLAGTVAYQERRFVATQWTRLSGIIMARISPASTKDTGQSPPAGGARTPSTASKSSAAGTGERTPSTVLHMSKGGARPSGHDPQAAATPSSSSAPKASDDGADGTAVLPETTRTPATGLPADVEPPALPAIRTAPYLGALPPGSAGGSGGRFGNRGKDEGDLR